ncbi:unnamed protein product [Toxocara canis]|uniref:Uncharacterized protein n=1 Tax=Toxocara canis TaxID=6265 RepID=A0A183UVQ6_TOXCA|nr:unnamed protein product [Toxocara canis]
MATGVHLRSRQRLHFRRLDQPIRRRHCSRRLNG